MLTYADGMPERMLNVSASLTLPLAPASGVRCGGRRVFVFFFFFLLFFFFSAQ
jgi:hypothetical protein